MIHLNNISKRYGSFLAVKDISFSVKKGEVVGLLGPNGAGKTTIMQMITGYYNPHSGAITIDGLDTMEDAVKTKSRIGYLPETNPLYEDLLVYEYLTFIARARGVDTSSLADVIDIVVQQCELHDFMYKPISSLSKGMRQRVGLAQAIIHDPDVIILDEPTSGLDPNQIKAIRKVITEFGKSKAVILSTHILQEVEAMCNRILIVNNGNIVAEGTNQEIASKLKGEEIFSLSLVGDIASDTIQTLKDIQGVTNFTVDATINETMHISVSGLSDQLSGEVLFDWAVSKKLRMKQLSQKSTSLESIFETLTTDTGGNQ